MSAFGAIGTPRDRAEAADTQPDPGARGLVTLAVAGMALRLALIGSGACDNRVVADDAFYYFTIARNIAAGLGPTFDGLAPTNGFHPLWLLLLTPLYAVARVLHAGSWTAVHAALTLCAAFDLASGILLARLLRRLGFARGAHGAAAVWFLSPFTVLLSLRGLESALTVTLFVVWLTVVEAAFRRAGDDPAGSWAPRGAGWGAGVGFVTGLAFLARTDNGPFLAFVLALLAGAAALRSRAGWLRALRFLVAAGLVAALVALPWFLWNLSMFGSPWQVSGAVKLQNPQVFGHVPGDPGNLFRFFWAFVWVPAYFVAGETMKQRGAFLTIAVAEWIVLILLLPGLLLALVRGPEPRADAREESRTGAPHAARGVAAACAAYLLAHAVVYTFVLRTYVVWYATVPTFILVLLVAGIAADRSIVRTPRGWRVVRAAVYVVCAAAIYAQYFHATKLRPRGEEMVVRPILTKIAHFAPGTRTVGIFNAGAAGYFAPEIGPFRVVNLDGLVNNEAVGAWRSGRYLEYLERRVDVVVDDADGTLNFMLGPGNRARFDARFPHWSPGSLVWGPDLQQPVR